MAAPDDPTDRERALLLEAFQAEAALSPAQVAYLRERGFLTETYPDYDGDYIDYGDWYDPRDDRDDALDAVGEAASKPTRRGGRRDRSGPEWSAERLCAHLGDLLERHRDTLLVLAHLAPEADDFAGVLADLSRADDLADRLADGYDAGTVPLAALWEAVALNVFRQPLADPEPTGPAMRAYRATLQATDLAQLPGKYVWLLRYEEVAVVQALLAAQRRLLAASGEVWHGRPGLVNRAMRQAPHLLGLLAHVLLHTSRPRDGGEERFDSVPPADHAPAYRRAWALAVRIDPDLVLPYLIDSTRGSETAGGLWCPPGWNALGYRVREAA